MLIAGCSGSGRKAKPDMKPYYSFESKKPLGTSIAYSLFQKQFSTANIYVDYTATKEFKDTYLEKSLCFIVANQFLLDSIDTDAMLEYVSKGNRLFVSANVIDQSFLNRFHLLFNNQYTDFLPYTDSKCTLQMLPATKYTKHPLYYYDFENHFGSDSVLTSESDKDVGLLSYQPLQKHGFSSGQKPQFISFSWGKGRIFLHGDPVCFSNYFLYQPSNRHYFEDMMRVVGEGRTAVIWNDYFRHGYEPGSNFSSLGIFSKEPSLKKALYLFLIFSLLLIFFMGKRRQRFIPVVQPVKNESIQFAEIVGNLYQSKNDHQPILRKMEVFLLDFIKTHFYLSSTKQDEAFFKSLALKTNIPAKDIQKMFHRLHQLKNAPSVSDIQLLEIYRQIQAIYSIKRSSTHKTKR